jgi:hypothetical protein
MKKRHSHRSQRRFSKDCCAKNTQFWRTRQVGWCTLTSLCCLNYYHLVSICYHNPAEFFGTRPTIGPIDLKYHVSPKLTVSDTFCARNCGKELNFEASGQLAVLRFRTRPRSGSRYSEGVPSSRQAAQIESIARILLPRFAGARANHGLIHKRIYRLGFSAEQIEDRSRGRAFSAE